MSSFEENLNRIARNVIPAAVKRGLGRAGMALMRDAVMATPKVPHDEGTLQGSASVFVGKDLVGTSESMSSGGNPTPATELETHSVSDGQFVATVGFNTPYAAHLHEGVTPKGAPINFKETGSGAKYLENKLNANRDKYMGIVAKAVRDA